MPQPPVKNPLYKAFMAQMQTAFLKDETGYRSAWSHYGIYTNLVKKMRTVNEGNAGDWVEKQKKDTALVQFLTKNKVDPFDYRQVRDFYAAKRNDVSQKILYQINATEQKIDKMPAVRAALGPDKKFSITMVDPNSTELITPPSP
jgi:hypothetical protein